MVKFFWIGGRDASELKNKGLTFACTDASRGQANASTIPISDYKGILGAGSYGDATDHTAAIKTWSEVHPTQFAPYDRYSVKLPSAAGWRRNHIPDNTVDTGGGAPLDWNTCSPSEFQLNTAGFLCVYGTMLDSNSYADPFFRKVGDLFLTARLRLRGLGPIDKNTDIPGLYANKLLKDERFLAEFKAKLGLSDKKMESLTIPQSFSKAHQHDFVELSPTTSERYFVGKVEKKSSSNKSSK